MRRNPLCLLLICSFFSYSNAQQLKKIDSLVASSLSNNNSSLRTLTELIKSTEVADAESLASRIFEKLSGTPSIKKANSLLAVGLAYENHKLPAWAIRFYKEANTQAEKLNDKQSIGRALKALAIIYYKEELFTDGLKYTYEAAKAFDELADFTNAALMLYQATAINYKSTNFSNAALDFDSFLNYCNRVPTDSVSGALKFSIMSGWNTVGLAHRKMKHWEKSLEAFEKSLQLAKISKNHFWVALINGNKGQTLFQMGKPREAIPFIQEDLRISSEYNQFSSAGFASVALAEIYVELKNPSSASIYLDRLPQFIAKAKEDRPQLRLAYLKAQAKYFALTNQFEKAHAFLLEQIKLGDSIHNEERSLQLAQIQARYNLEKKETEIHLLAQNNELQQKQIGAQRKLIIAAIAFTALIITFLIYFILSYNKARKQNAIIDRQRIDIKEKNSELEAQSQTLLKQNEEIEEKNTELEAQSFTLLQQNEIIRRSNQDLEHKVSERTSQLQETISELDTFLYHASHDIRRPIATLLGLENVARAENVRDNKIFDHVSITAREMDNMLSKLQMAYRINQPADDLREISIHNVAKEASVKFSDQLQKEEIQLLFQGDEHVTAVTSPSLLIVAFQNLIENAIQFRNQANESRWIKISSSKNMQGVKIIVEDNGIGIEPKHIDQVFELYYRGTDRSKGNGVGLYLTKKSLAKIKGVIEVTSTFGKGTAFTITIPTQQKT